MRRMVVSSDLLDGAVLWPSGGYWWGGGLWSCCLSMSFCLCHRTRLTPKYKWLIEGEPGTRVLKGPGCRQLLLPLPLLDNKKEEEEEEEV